MQKIAFRKKFLIVSCIALLPLTALAEGHFSILQSAVLQTVNNDTKTVESLRLKAKAGDGESAYTLAKMYYDGQGVAKDNIRAAAWLKVSLGLGMSTKINNEIYKEGKKPHDVVFVAEKLTMEERQKADRIIYSLFAVILKNISLKDVPAKYKPALTQLPFTPASKTTSAIKTTSMDHGGFSMEDTIQLAKLDPKECDVLKGAPTVSVNNDIFSSCLTKMAVIVGDPAICLGIKDAPKVKDVGNCLSWFSMQRKTVSSCFYTERPAKLEDDFDQSGSFTYCVKNVIVQDPTPEGCALLSQTLDGSTDHADDCYVSLARMQKNAKWCTSSVKIAAKQDACFTGAATATQDAKLCDKIHGNNIEEKKRCQLGVVLNAKTTVNTKTGVSKKPEGCETLSTADEKDKCYEAKFYQTKDPTFCGKIQKKLTGNDFGKTSQQSCYNGAVFDLKDVAICKAVVDKDVKAECYEQFGSFPESEKDCESIEKDFQLQIATCYWNLAGKKKDKTICEKIDPKITETDGMRRNIKEHCLKIY
jgi:hypothetical protein